MAIRLLKACKDLNIGISTAIAFCEKIGKEIAMDVSSRIDDELYLRLAKEFNKDLALKLEAKSQEREIPKAENNKISLIDIVDMVKESKNRPNREGTQNETTDSKSLEKITSNQDTTKNNIENNTTSNEVMEKNKKEKYGLMKYGNCGTKAEQNNFINQVQELTGLSDLTFGKISNYLGEVKQENDILYIETKLTTTENEQLFFTFHKTPEDQRYEWGNLSVQTLKEKHKNSNTLNLKDLGYDISKSEQRSLLEELNQLTGKSIKSISILSQHLTTYEDIDKLRLIHSNLVDTNGNPIVFWFVQDFSNKNVYTDFECGLLSDFELKKKIVSSYQWGKKIFFTDGKLARKLLDDVKSRAMPEQWSWDKNAGKDKFDILQSYLTYTFTKLLNEKTSIREGKDQTTGKTIAAFNTNLMDKCLVDIFIAGEKIEYKKGYLLKDPYLVKKQDLMRYEINYEFLPPPTYFTNITDIIFNSDWDMADDDEKMKHVLKRKDKRIEKEITISELHTAITFSRKMAQRNYKYVVPMYYPEENRIQLLMPLYFEGEYKDEPDGVLILTPDADTKFYVPETIIGLREAYMDARLISKPDNAWLEPSSLRKKENEN